MITTVLGTFIRLFDPAWDQYFNMASKAFPFISGSEGAIVILYHVIRAFRRRAKIQKTLLVVREPAAGQVVP